MSKRITCTILVQEYLQAVDDMVTAAQVRASTNLTPTQASAALYHLRRYELVDYVEDGDGTKYWYAVTDAVDPRRCVVQEREEEEPGHRNRQPRPRA